MAEPERGLVAITPAFKQDAPGQFQRLRALGPVHRARLSSGVDGWLVIGYESARAVLTHPDLRKDPTPATEALAAAGYVVNRPGTGLGGNMLESDPPAHSRLRRLASGAFTPRRTASLAPRIQRIADDLIDAFPADGQTDLVTSYTAPLPVTVIAELLGIPPRHRDSFRVWSSKALDVTGADHLAGLASLHGLLRDVVADKRQAPQDDLLSALVAARDEGDGLLSEQELVGTAILLVVAGHETTVNLLGNSVLALLRHPDQLQLLRDRPGLIPGAVEEFLRYDGSVEFSTLRYAAADVVIGGQAIPRGSVVAVAFPSASRDAPLAGGDDPAALDITRPAVRHLAFGHGIHHCLGAPLARLEATIALETLLRRLSQLELTVPPEDISWIPAGIMRGPLSLPVRYQSVVAV